MLSDEEAAAAPGGAPLALDSLRALPGQPPAAYRLTIAGGAPSRSSTGGGATGTPAASPDAGPPPPRPAPPPYPALLFAQHRAFRAGSFDLKCKVEYPENR